MKKDFFFLTASEMGMDASSCTTFGCMFSDSWWSGMFLIFLKDTPWFPFEMFLMFIMVWCAFIVFSGCANFSMELFWFWWWMNAWSENMFVMTVHLTELYESKAYERKYVERRLMETHSIILHTMRFRTLAKRTLGFLTIRNSRWRGDLLLIVGDLFYYRIIKACSIFECKFESG